MGVYYSRGVRTAASKTAQPKSPELYGMCPLSCLTCECFSHADHGCAADAIKDCRVWLASEQKELAFRELFPESGSEQRTVFQFARSFG